jgi:hypothetical protein
MSEDDMKSGQTPSTPETEKKPAEKSLEDQLKDLKEAALDQVDANIADLTKLIEDTKKAEDEYKKVYEQLKDQDIRLNTECGTVSSALKAALGGDAGVEAVEKIVTAKLKAVSVAKVEHDKAKTAVESAKGNAETRAKDLAAAQAKLVTWRKPGDSIGKRLKKADGLIEEIKKLRNASRRGEAYWKLALGDHANVPGQEFLKKVLNAQPEVIHPDDLRGRIRTSWNEFKALRKEAATADAKLADAQADLKLKEAEFADLSKNLIKAISDALAEREDASNAA